MPGVTRIASRLAIGLLCLGYALQACAGGPAWAGIWHGTVGKYPLTLCLQQRDDDWIFGAYYYDKHYQIITLTPPGAKAPPGRLTLVENVELPNPDKSNPAKKPAYANWDLKAPAGDVLEGSFHGLGSAVLPIALKRIADASASCSSDSFAAALEVTPRLITDRSGRNDAAVVEKLDFQGHADFQIAGFQFTATDEGMKKINAALRQELLQNGKDAMDCRRQALESNGYDGAFDVTITPELIGTHWLTTRTASDTDCGGAHPNAGLDYETWDRVSGRKVDPWTWLTQAGVRQKTTNAGTPQASTVNEIRPALKSLLRKHWPRAQDEDCNSAVDDADAWQLRPGPHGMLFSPILPHAIAACAEDDDIPYDELASLLTAKARDIVKDIESDSSAKPN